MVGLGISGFLKHCCRWCVPRDGFNPQGLWLSEPNVSYLKLQWRHGAREVFFNDGTQKLHTSRASFVEDWRCWTLKRYDIVYKHILLCRDMIIKKHIYVCRIHSIKMRSFFQKHGNAGPPTTSQTSKKRATERVKLDTLCFDVFFSSFSQRFHVNAFWKGDLASCLDLIDCGLLGMYHQAFFLNWVSYLALPQAESAPQPSSERRKGEKKGWEILHHLGCIKAL